MACANILDAFAYATEHLDQYVYKQASHKSIWLNLINRGTFPRGIGVTATVFGVGAIEPTAAETWSTMSLSSGQNLVEIDGVSGAACTDSFNNIYWGYYTKDYHPEQYQLQGPIVCEKNLSFAHNVEEFISNYIQKIGIRAQRTWERRYAYWHDYFSKKAVVIPDFQSTWYEGADADVPEAANSGTTCPECELSQEHLEFVAADLIENGATNPDQAGFIDMTDIGPLFPLLISMEQSQRIARANDDYRQDVRIAFAAQGDGNPLMKRIGASRIIGNFRHIIDPLPRRFTCSSGTFTEVQPFIDVTTATSPATAKGTLQRIRPAWRTAPYEAARVLSPDLFKSEIVAPFGAGLSWSPLNYMGEWVWKTGAYKWDTDCVDPMETRGRHFATFMHAPKPNPLAVGKYGWLIIYKRCIGNQLECVTCSS